MTLVTSLANLLVVTCGLSFILPSHSSPTLLLPCRLVIDLVLGTDMVHHFNAVKAFAEASTRLGSDLAS
jgi:hypothetical protein